MAITPNVAGGSCLNASVDLLFTKKKRLAVTPPNLDRLHYGIILSFLVLVDFRGVRVCVHFYSYHKS